MLSFKQILIDAIIATILVFTIGYAINAIIDNFRFSDLLYKLNRQNVERDALQLQILFSQAYKDKKLLCEVFKKRINDYKKELTLFGNTLDNYGSLTKIYRDLYLTLRTDLYVTHLTLYNMINQLNKICKEYYYITPILFIYKLNDETDLLQGYALEDFVKKHENFIVVSIATDFASKIGLGNESSIIINGKKYKPLIAGKRLEEVILNTTFKQ